MADYATLTDSGAGGSVNFMMDKDWRPTIKERGGLFYPLGHAFPVKNTDGTKGIGGEFTIVSTSDTMDAAVRTLLASVDTMTLTLPTGESYTITLDPSTDRTGTAQFSLMLWQWVNVWTVRYVQVA